MAASIFKNCYKIYSKCYFPPLVTSLLTSTKQCWVQRKMVNSSDSHHIQYLCLCLDTTETSRLRSACDHHVCLFLRFMSSTNLLTKLLSFSGGYILKESPSIQRLNLRACLQPCAQCWKLRNKTGKPDRDDRGAVIT